jgi:DNA-directed RNA polymerase specialized sigma24 family protein
VTIPLTGERYPDFELFFRALYPKAVMLAQRILGDEALAEDAAQERSREPTANGER